ncbi:MAG TPA: metallophosphoesterase [Sumerlaeia bacterium]|nr:metallophosphoesterase [Sumerlaeia bacterium]
MNTNCRMKRTNAVRQKDCDRVTHCRQDLWVPRSVSRRDFIRTSFGAAGALAVGACSLFESRSPAGTISFGILTDTHYADKDPGGERHYRDSIAKMRQCVEVFNKRNLPFAVELGDLVDAAPKKETELGFLKTISGHFSEFQGERHYVLGNHCVAAFTKEEFLGNCGTETPKGYYSFDCGGFHFVILDANFRGDGAPYAAGNFDWTDSNLSDRELVWLRNDLRAARDKRAVLFVHQNLHNETEMTGVKNGARVRRILEDAGNVRVVLQGHHHAGAHARINGIDYFTLRAMVEGPGVENNSFAVVTINEDNSIAIDGFGQQADRLLT